MRKKDKERKKTTSCGAVTWHKVNGKIEVLLIKQLAHKDRWRIPKGHMNKGESLEECAVREVKEGAGVDVAMELRLPDCFVTNQVEDKTVVDWLARPVGSHDPNHNDPDSEVADARWFPVNALPEIMMYQRPMLATAVELLKERARSPVGEPI